MSSSSTSSSASAPALPGGLPVTENAYKYLESELEYRLRFVIQESAKFSRQAHVDTLTPVHVEAAWRVLSGGMRAGGTYRKSAADWVQHPGTIAARLILSDATAPMFAASRNVSGKFGSTEHPSSSSSIDITSSSSSTVGASVSANNVSGTREAQAILAAITAAISKHSAVTSINGEGRTEEDSSKGVSMLLAQLATHDAMQLVHLMPSIVATIRGTTEECLLLTSSSSSAAAASSSSSAAAVARSAAHQSNQEQQQQQQYASSRAQLRRILRVVASLVANSALPLEQSIGEVLALTCSILLHAVSEENMGIVKNISAKNSATTTATPSSSGSSSDDAFEQAVQEDGRVRAYAAQVLSAVVERAARVWPEVRAQAGNVLLDAVASSVELVEVEEQQSQQQSNKNNNSNNTENTSNTKLQILSWSTLYGSVIGLAGLVYLQQETVVPLVRAVQSSLLLQLEDDGSQKSNKGSSNGIGAIWRALCLDAAKRVLAVHTGGQKADMFDSSDI